MSLSCECNDFDMDIHDWGYLESPENFILLKTKKRRSCKSCKKLINKEELVLIFKRFRYPRTIVEMKIHGEDTEIPLAPHYWCEDCGDQYFNLSNLGYCVPPEANVWELLKEYAEIQSTKGRE